MTPPIISARAQARQMFISESLAELAKPLQALTNLKQFLETAQSRPIAPDDSEKFYSLEEVIEDTFCDWREYIGSAQYSLMVWAIVGEDQIMVYFRRNPDEVTPEVLAEHANLDQERANELAQMGYA